MQDRACKFSPCRKYRYTLWREMGDLFTANNTEFIQFIGLNPSTADEVQDDPTIRRIMDFSKQFGFQNLCMTNIFGWRDTDPKEMKKQADPIGLEDNDWLLRVANSAKMIIVAWGNDGEHLKRGQRVGDLLRQFSPKVYCLGTNSDGSPKHPLYLSSSLRPVRYTI